MHKQPVITVDADSAGERLDAYLARVNPSLSRSKIQKDIEAGNVILNNSKAISKTRLKSGDIIEQQIEDVSVRSTAPKAQDIKIDILFEDEFIAAVDKPAGMVVHPGNGVKDQTLVNAILFKMASLSTGNNSERPGIIHRLDKNTSGVLLVAKTDEAHRAFSAMFASRDIKKIYTGICMGIRPAPEGTISAALGRSRRCPTKQSVREDGKEAVTEYSLTAFYCGMSLVCLKPHTGRTHQIRLHCRHAGFPIIGDSVYGTDKEDVLKLPPMERPFAFSVLKCFDRHALHAKSIAFKHPFTGKNIEVEAPYPLDFVNAMSKFKSLSVVEDHTN